MNAPDAQSFFESSRLETQSSQAVQSDEIDLRALLRTLWRRRRIIIGTVIIGTLLAAVVVYQLTPQYRGSALVLIEARKSKVVDIEAVLSGLPAGFESINSEIQVISSRNLAARVAKREKLDLDPEFNPGLGKPSFLSRARVWVSSLFVDQKGGRETRTPSDVVTSVMEHLTVTPKPRTRVIEIKFHSADAKKAARITNDFAELYLVSQLEAKFQATKRATEWLSGRLTVLRRQVEISEKAVEKYRQEAGLVRGKGETTLAASQISDLSAQLIVARAKIAEAEARLGEVKRLVKGRNGVESMAAVMQSPVIQSLRLQEAQIIRKIAEMSNTYGSKHPRMINARAELRDLRRSTAAEVQKIIAGLETNVGVAKARAAALARGLKSFEARVAILNTKEVRLRALEREAKSNRTLLKTFLDRFKQTTAQATFNTPDARIISTAVVPSAPYAPRKTLIVMGALIASFALGVALVFLRERLEAGFRGMSQVEQFTGLPALGLVPALEGQHRKSEPQDYVLDHPASAFSEALRNLHVSSTLSNVDDPPVVVMVTSAVPKEGKSSVAMTLARLVAQSGQKSIVVDCDLRRPTIGEGMGVSAEPGLVDVLARKMNLHAAIQNDPKSDAKILSSGIKTRTPAELLGSGQMSKLLAELRSEFEFVVLDSPPVLAVSDARLLAAQCDTTVFLVRWGTTKRESVEFAIRQITSVGGNVAGVVLSRVNMKKHAAYGYADSEYYAQNYRDYYTA